MGSWNHTLRVFTPEELARWQERERDARVKWGEPSHGAVNHWEECSAPRCHERPLYQATYDYVTGRAGRVSWARKQLCPAHAARFAAKNTFELPPSPLEQDEGA